jgi:hypothetical protein
MAALPVHVAGNIWVGVDLITAKVTSDPIRISKKAKQEVEWYCLDKKDSVLVCFEEPDPKRNGQKRSPFEATEFLVPMGGSVCSGPPGDHATPDENNAYKYAIYNVDSTGRKTLLLDPRIIITP